MTCLTRIVPLNSRLLDWWLYIRASYWFVPSLMAITAMGSAAALVRLDTSLGSDWLRDFGWLYVNQPEGARAVLSTVAGSMITVAGVTFSMTLLAVAHASSQIGPRLLSGFMRDRGNQFTLGTFIATFLYCLMVLRTVQSGADAQGSELAAFVPHIAITGAVALAVLSVMVLIYFIHHVPVSISVSNVIAGVGDELVEAIRCTYPNEADSCNVDDATVRAKAMSTNGTQLRVKDNDGGYLRVLDFSGLVESAKKHDLVIDVLLRPGDFAVAGQTLIRIDGVRELDDEARQDLYESFSFGIERTQEQDVLFPVEQLLEVLGKALSPGINGQYTALLCLNQFERALAELLRRYDPSGKYYDIDGNLRLTARPVTQQEFVNLVFGPLRQYIQNDWISTQHVIKMLDRLSSMPAGHLDLAEFSSMVEAIREDVDGSSMTEAEKRSLMQV